MNAIYTQPRTLLSPFGFPIYGADSGGYATDGDRIITLGDGTDPNTVFEQMRAALKLWNDHRTALVDLISYWHTVSADAVPAAGNPSGFELASEYGEPEALRVPNNYFLAGYTFEDYDRATRFTWKALRDMDQRQVLAAHDEALSADNKLVTGTILSRLFDPVSEENEHGQAAYGLYNGTDGMKPPSFLGNSFPANHSHYRVSGNTDIDSEDIESAIRDIRSHGYGLTDSQERIVVLCNEVESEKIQSFRAGQENFNSAKAKYDFIPAKTQPTFVLQGGGQLVGNQPEGNVFGTLPSVGDYGPASIVESSFIPSGYFAVVSVAAPGHTSNIIGVRQHTVTAYQGLRQIPGAKPDYPLMDSFYSRAFGVGVRHRGAGVCTQLSAAGPYVTPEIAR